MRDFIVGLVIVIAVAIVSIYLALLLIGYAIDKHYENEDNIVLIQKLDNQ